MAELAFAVEAARKRRAKDGASAAAEPTRDPPPRRRVASSSSSSSEDEDDNDAARGGAEEDQAGLQGLLNRTDHEELARVQQRFLEEKKAVEQKTNGAPPNAPNGLPSRPARMEDFRAPFPPRRAPPDPSVSIALSPNGPAEGGGPGAAPARPVLPLVNLKDAMGDKLFSLYHFLDQVQSRSSVGQPLCRVVDLQQAGSELVQLKENEPHHAMVRGLPYHEVLEWLQSYALIDTRVVNPLQSALTTLYTVREGQRRRQLPLWDLLRHPTHTLWLVNWVATNMALNDQLSHGWSTRPQNTEALAADARRALAYFVNLRD